MGDMGRSLWLQLCIYIVDVVKGRKFLIKKLTYYFFDGFNKLCTQALPIIAILLLLSDSKH